MPKVPAMHYLTTRAPLHAGSSAATSRQVAAPSRSHLAKVYPMSTSMHLAWVADPFFSDFQKRSPLSCALSSKHKSYAKLF